MASVTHALMPEETANFPGFSKQKSIWNTPLAQEENAWAPRKPMSTLFSPRSPQSHIAQGNAAAPVSQGSVPQIPTASTGAAPITAPQGQQYPYSYFRLGAQPVQSVPVSPLKPGLASTGVNAGGAVSSLPTSAGSISGASSSAGDDDLIPTAIVVKNIPFAIKKEQLVDVMTNLGLPLPYAFNYHFDNGVFRGLAFANYSTAEETAVVISALNGREIGGRKLRVEYKKMLPQQERERIEREKRERRGQLEEQHTSQGSSLASSPLPQHQTSQIEIDLNDRETLDLYTSLVLFSASKTPEVALERVSPLQRQIIYQLCGDIGLTIEDRDDGKLYIISSGETKYLSPLFPSMT